MPKKKLSLAEQRLVWLDVETTGLDPNKDKILELACVVTDYQLKILGEVCFVLNAKIEGEPLLSKVLDMHSINGLFDDVEVSTLKVTQVQNLLITFIRVLTEPCEGIDGRENERPLLAGSSVHFDRSFLRAKMPLVESLLHYRSIDVSTLSSLAKHWDNGAYLAEPARSFTHRARQDIHESIALLDHYRRILFLNELDDASVETSEE